MITKTLTICAFALFTILYNCDNEPYDGDIFSENNACTLAILETNNAATDYFTAIQENANEYCLIYKNALENQIEMCGDENGTLQLIIEELDDCVIEPDLCELAIAATEVAQENYENTTNNDFEEMCNLYKEALQYQIVVCGDDGTLQSRISELGDCEPVYLDTIGTWKLVSWLTDQSLDIDNDGVVTNDYLEEIDCYTNETIFFDADGTGVFYFRSFADITFSPVPNSESDVDFFINCYQIDETKTFTWVQFGNTIMLTMADGTLFNFFRNANSLFVAIDDGFSATSTVDNTTVISERITFVYEKI